ncbi:MAG: hypothetical protein IH884_11195, partial [Myxococcales bacterium]|nr:hypothetical protein [Myxococcales bacterium]
MAGNGDARNTSCIVIWRGWRVMSGGNRYWYHTTFERQMLRLSRFLLVVALLALAAGCKGGSDNGAATEPPQATATVGSATVTPDIRQVALAAQPGLSEFLATVGGEADPSRIIYADLTGSGGDEAVFPISSGGEGGDVAVFVFGYGDEGIEELLR